MKILDFFGEITEHLYRKHDRTSCGGRTRLALSRYIHTSLTNILATASCLMIQYASVMSNINKSNCSNSIRDCNQLQVMEMKTKACRTSK